MNAGKGFLRNEIITENKRLEFYEFTGGAGIRDLTIQNEGEVAFEVKGVKIEANQSFVVESDIALLNEDIEITFDDCEGVKKAVVFYIVEKIC